MTTETALVDRLVDALDALQGMVLQYCTDGGTGLIREDYVSAQESALEILEAAGLVEERKPTPRPLNWFQIPGFADPFEAGYYLTELDRAALRDRLLAGK